MKTKHLRVVLLTLLICLLGSNKALAYDIYSNGIYYNVLSETDKTVEVTSMPDNEEYSGTISIPGSVNGYTVTSIGERAFKDCLGLTSVTIPNSVTSIGNYAFYECSGLTSVTIPNSVTSIGNYAFRGCLGLTSVTIPNSVTSIGFGAFYDCSGLTSVTIPNSVTSIGNYAFYDCSGLTSVTIPNSVTSIGDWAFFFCSVTSVDIPNSVTSIGNYAFRGCSGLTSVTIPNSVTSIGAHAFRGCSGLTSVTIPNSVTSIGQGAFSGCSGLTSIQVESSNTHYDSRNNCNAIIETSTNTLIAGCKNTVIPNSVTSIGNSAFYECSGLTSVTIPNSVTSIGERAFENCTGLTSVTIPNSVTSIGAHAFRGCSGLTSVTIPNSVTYIGNWAFYECSGLTSVTIPNSVTSIDSWAFENCSGLTSVYVENPVPISIPSSVFDGINTHATLYVPVGSLAAYQEASGWNEFSTIEEYYVAVDLVTAEGDFYRYGAVSSGFCSIWQSASEDPQISLSVTSAANNMSSSNWALYTGGGKNCQYDLNISEDYRITGYSVTFKNATAGYNQSITPVDGEGNASGEEVATTADDEEVTVTVSNILDLTTSFVLKGENKGAIITKFLVTYVPVTTTATFTVRDGNGQVMAEGSKKFAPGEKLSLPADMQRAFCEYELSATEMGSEDMNVDVTYTFNPPFTVSESFESATWYLLNIHSNHYYMAFSSLDTPMPCKASGITTPTNADGELWAFVGNPYTGFTIYNMAAGSTASLAWGADDDAIFTTPKTSGGSSNGGDYFPVVSTGNTQKWFVESSTDRANGFYIVTTNKLYGINARNNFAYWTQDKDHGSTFVATEIPTITLTAEYGTYCSTKSLDFTDTGLEAYVATNYSDGNLILTRVYNVSAGTGIVVKGTAGTTYIISESSTPSYSANLLRGTTEAITLNQTDGAMTNFILSNGSEGIGFYMVQAAGGTLAAGKAYLQLPTAAISSTRAFGLTFTDEDGNVTGITQLSNDDNSEGWYDLSGRRVGNPRKGVYVRNGKKVIFK